MLLMFLNEVGREFDCLDVVFEEEFIHHVYLCLQVSKGILDRVENDLVSQGEFVIGVCIWCWGRGRSMSRSSDGGGGLSVGDCLSVCWWGVLVFLFCAFNWAPEGYRSVITIAVEAF